MTSDLKNIYIDILKNKVKIRSIEYTYERYIVWSDKAYMFNAIYYSLQRNDILK